jgi:hypothetical protein
MKGKNLTTFVRFGGLDLKNQKGFENESANYHAPPATKGFYAMPKVAQEFWLVGSLDKYQPGVLPKRPTGQSTNEEFTIFEEKKKKAYSAIRKEFSKTKGNIWHHLEEWTEQPEILSRKGSWVKTSIKVWQKAFSKMSLECRYGHEVSDMSSISAKSINQTKGILGFYSKDHCEVFFDEKV